MQLLWMRLRHKSAMGRQIYDIEWFDIVGYHHRLSGSLLLKQMGFIVMDA